MYCINKIVGWAMSPMGMLFFGLAAGVVVRCRHRKAGNFLISALLVFFWILGCGITTRWIGVPLEGEEVNVDHSSFSAHTSSQQYDAVVLLGGGMGVHATCGRVEMFGAADRVWHAARLWKAYHAEGDDLKMTLSGGCAAKSTIPLLRDLGVEGDVFLLFEEARNTEEEAKLIAAKGMKRVLLVTSAWHMPRAKTLFERAGLDVTPAPCDYEMHYAAERSIEFADFFPFADVLARNSYAVKEWVARLGYSLLRR